MNIVAPHNVQVLVLILSSYPEFQLALMLKNPGHKFDPIQGFQAQGKSGDAPYH